MLEFRQETVFCLGYRFSKHKITGYTKIWGPWLPALLATPMGLFRYGVVFHLVLISTSRSGFSTVGTSL